MSGLEIAGVVLAVIPALQLTLGYFQGDSFKTLAKYQHAISSLSRKLALEHARLHHTCSRLLAPVVSEEKLAELLADSSGSLWKDEAVVKRLRTHLGEGKYNLYLSALQDLAACLIALRADLGVQDSAGTSNSGKWYEKAAKRVKASVKHKRHLEILGEIRACNETLHSLVVDVLDMEPIRPDKRSKLDTKKWEFLRKLAGNLHSTLEDQLSCKCRHCHIGHLRLESRGGQEELEVRFGVLFTLDVQPRGWHETEITIVRADISRPPSPPNVAVRTSRVTIHDPRSDNANVQKASVAKSSQSRIEDLCEEVRKSRSKPGCIGFVEDNHNREYYIHSIFPPTADGDDLSLAQLLSRKEKSDVPALRARDRYELAVILATSILQLHSTPWLDERNWREDIRFVKAKDKRAPFAYIRKRFNHATLPRSEPADLEKHMLRRNETVFALGVVLIELSLGRSLRSFQQPKDLGTDGKPNFLTDLAIARRLVANEVQEKEGQRYANTVNRCINCIFDGIEVSLEDEQFRQAFYASAVVPLHGVRDDCIKD